MNLKHASEQILFGETLLDKFTSMESLVDVSYPPLITTPVSPGRPKELQISNTKGGHKFPNLATLETDVLARGHVMHFLANHELLALELMALALLKFPDAPTGFRQMVAHTMSEEQDHLRRYIERMEGFGVGFGELKLNDFFWKIISKMQSPTEYVAWLSMTFEQANLDFSKHYQTLFTQLGDKPSSELMQVVYDDEIGHLGGGIRWYKYFTKCDSLWKSWSHFVKDSINPVRAKGQPFDIEGRMRAGLDNEYIQKMWLYQKSRGKVPVLSWWNSGAELENTGAKLQGKALDLNYDLDTLAFHIISQDDLVLLQKKPSDEYMMWLKKYECSYSEYTYDAKELKNRYLLFAQPWSWTPRVINFLEENTLVKTEKTKPLVEEKWNLLHSKIEWRKFLGEFFDSFIGQEFLHKFPNHIDMSSLKDFKIITSLETFEEAWEFYNTQDIGRCVLQAEFSVSGHHLKMVDLQQGISDSLRKWVVDLLAQGKRLMMEPFWGDEQNINLSFLYAQDGRRPLGITKFYTQNGKYKGHWLGNFDVNFTQEMKIWAFPFVKELQNILKQAVKQWLGDWPCPCGIDLLVYRTQEGELKIHPGLEINPRWTMGHIALKWMEKLAPLDAGVWRVVPLKNFRGVNGESALDLWERQTKDIQVGEQHTTFAHGEFFVNDITTAKTWGSLIQVKSLKEWIDN